MQHFVSPAATRLLRPAGLTLGELASESGRGRAVAAPPSAARRPLSSLSCRAPGYSAPPAAFWKLQRHRRSAPAKKVRTRPSPGRGQGREAVRSVRAVHADITGWSVLVEVIKAAPPVISVWTCYWVLYQQLPLTLEKRELDTKKRQREMKEEKEAKEFEKNDENVLASIRMGCTLPEYSKRFIRREAPLAKIVTILRAERAEQGSYYVLEGPPTVGKTALALLACGDVGGGVLRVSIDAPYAPEKTRPNFAETIAKALNLKMRTDDTDPWETVKTALTKAAAKFKASEGKPVVLVVDHATYLLNNPQFLKMLLSYAETWADNRLVQVVFVAADGAFPRFARDFDKGGGRLKILAIPGPTKDEALAFLELEGLLRASDDPATRAKLARVAELVGDRYMQAKSDATTARGVAVTEQDVETQVSMIVEEQLGRAKLSAHLDHTERYAKAHGALVALAEAGGRAPMAMFLECMSYDRELLQALIDAGVVSTAGPLVVEFPSRAIEWFMKAKKMPLPLPPPPCDHQHEAELITHREGSSDRPPPAATRE